MIKFVCGDIPGKNATVTFGDGPPSDAHAERDDEGHITVTVDAVEPAEGEAVELVLHDENDGTYRGSVAASEGHLIFT